MDASAWTGNRDGITALQQWLLAYIIRQQQFDIVDFILCEIEDVISNNIKMGPFKPYILVGSMGRHTREAGTDLFMESVEEWSSMKTTFSDYKPAKMGDKHRVQRAQVRLTGILLVLLRL